MFKSRMNQKGYAGLSFLAAIFIIALAIVFMAFDRKTVDGGEEGVYVLKPYMFGTGGVDMVPLSKGSAWTAGSTDMVVYNVKPQLYPISFKDLNSSDNVPIDFKATITLKIRSASSPVIHKESGKDWYNQKVRDVFEQVVRKYVRQESSTSLRKSDDVITEVQNNIAKDMKSYLADINLPVDVYKVQIGRITPPDEVLTEAAKTAAEKQREQTQAARTKAENARAAAETASAKADKAYATEFDMTTEQFLRNKELDIQVQQNTIMLKSVETGKGQMIFNVGGDKAQPVYGMK